MRKLRLKLSRALRSRPRQNRLKPTCVFVNDQYSRDTRSADGPSVILGWRSSQNTGTNWPNNWQIHGRAGKPRENRRFDQTITSVHPDVDIVLCLRRYPAFPVRRYETRRNLFPAMTKQNAGADSSPPVAVRQDEDSDRPTHFTRIYIRSIDETLHGESREQVARERERIFPPPLSLSLSPVRSHSENSSHRSTPLKELIAFRRFSSERRFPSPPPLPENFISTTRPTTRLSINCGDEDHGRKRAE